MSFTKANKDANAQIAIKHLIQKHWTPMQAAAIIGNLTQESYLNPDTPRGDKGTAMGLAQWRGDRLVKFQQIIGKHCEDSSLTEQLDFVDWELRNSDKRAGDKLKKAKTLEEATKIVDTYYERSAGTELDRRIKFATATLSTYYGGSIPEVIKVPVVKIDPYKQPVKVVDEPKVNGFKQFIALLVKLFGAKNVR